MKPKFDGGGPNGTSSVEDEQLNKAVNDEVAIEDLATLYQVGKQDVASYGEAANTEVFATPANSEILPAQKNEESKELNLTFNKFNNDQATAEELKLTFDNFNKQQASAEEAENISLTRNESAVSEMTEAGAVDKATTETVGEGGSEALGDAEALSESLEAFKSAKAKYEDLKAQIEKNNFQAHFLYEMQSANMNIQAAEYATNNDNKVYTNERKADKATNATNFLNNLNDRLIVELARLKPEPSYVDSMETVTINSELDKNPQVEAVEASTVNPELVPMTETESAPVTVTETTPVEKTQTTPVVAGAVPVVGSETAPVPVGVEAEPVVGTVEKALDVPVTPEVTAALAKYQEKRAEWKQEGGPNDIFKKTEAEYKRVLADYYERRGGLEIMRTGARSLLGLQPKFPAEVTELQARYSEAKKFYALEFSKLIALRGAAHEGNADYSLNRKEVKKAMAQKFILKPAEQLLNLQKETVQAEKERLASNKVMALMSKHKWGIKVGTVVLAGAIGLASGGASVAFAAAGSRVVRMAAGMAGGALAGAGVNRAMKGYAETGAKNVASAEENARENFDLSNFGKLEAEVLSSYADKDTRDTRRTVATGLAAGVAGFGSGVMSAEIPVGVPDYSNEGNNYPASANNENYSNEGLNYPNPIEVVEAIPSNEYIVESGDNLWNIMRTEYADALKDLTPAEQNRVLAELFERAKADGALRESIGLRDSNNLNQIYPGEKLQLQGLGNELQEILNQEKAEVISVTPVADSGIVETAGPVTTPMTETVFGDENAAGISVKPSEDWEGDNEAGISVKPELDEEPFSSTSENTFAPRPYSPDGNYFAQPEYQEFALGVMGGVEQITNSVNVGIDAVEGKQDVFEALQGKPRVFDVLKGLTVESLNNLGKTPGAVENFATTNGVEENMLREWLHKFDQIKDSDLPRTETTRFGDLFTRSVIESHVNGLFKK